MVDESDLDQLSVQGAIETIADALVYDAPLRVRGEGLSWMVWGLVWAVLALATGARGDGWGMWVGHAILVPVWALLGLLGTSAVWRLAGIAQPALSPSPQKVAVGVASFIVGLFFVNAIGFSVHDATGSYVVLALALPAVPWGLVGWLQWRKLSRGGRRATIALGALMSLLFAAYVEFVMASMIFWDDVGMAVYAAINGGIPFLVGLAWTFRR